MSGTDANDAMPDDDRWLYGDEPDEEPAPPGTIIREPGVLSSPGPSGERIDVAPVALVESASALRKPDSPEEPLAEDPTVDGPPAEDDFDEPLPDLDDEGGDKPDGGDKVEKMDDDLAEPFDDEDREPFEEDDEKRVEKDGDADSDSSDDNVNITIGEAAKAAPPAPYGSGYGFLKRFGTHVAIGKSANAIPLGEIEGPGTIGGHPAHEFNMNTLDDFPWRKPGADITDYFNYGFNEETWRAYCDRQRRLRVESGALSYKQGQALHVNALQPNLNPQPRFRDRDNAPQTNGFSNTAGPPLTVASAISKKTIDVIGGSTSRRSLEIDETKSIQVMNTTSKAAEYPKDDKFDGDFNPDLSVPPPDMSRPPPSFTPGMPPPGPPPGPPPVVRPPFDFPPMRPPPMGPPRMDPFGDMFAPENDPYYRSYEPPGLPPPMMDWLPPGLPPPPMGMPPPMPPGFPGPPPPPPGLSGPPPMPIPMAPRPPGEDGPPGVRVKPEPGREDAGGDEERDRREGETPSVDTTNVPIVTVIPSRSHRDRRSPSARREKDERRYSSRRRSRSRSKTPSDTEESSSRRRDRDRDRDRGDRERDRDRDRDRSDRDRDRDRRDKDRDRDRDRDRDTRHRSSRKRTRQRSSSPGSD